MGKRTAYNRRFRHDNKERVAKQKKAYIARNPIQFLLSQAKSRAKKNGMEFDLVLEDLLPAPTFCPVYGVELIYGSQKPKCAESASLDRKDNSRGYVKGNVAIISLQANIDKQACSRERLHERLEKAEKDCFKLRALLNYVGTR